MLKKTIVLSCTMLTSLHILSSNHLLPKTSKHQPKSHTVKIEDHVQQIEKDVQDKIDETLRNNPHISEEELLQNVLKLSNHNHDDHDKNEDSIDETILNAFYKIYLKYKQNKQLIDFDHAQSSTDSMFTPNRPIVNLVQTDSNDIIPDFPEKPKGISKSTNDKNISRLKHHQPLIKLFSTDSNDIIPKSHTRNVRSKEQIIFFAKTDKLPSPKVVQKKEDKDQTTVFAKMHRLPSAKNTSHSSIFDQETRSPLELNLVHPTRIRRIENHRHVHRQAKSKKTDLSDQIEAKI